MSRLIAITDVCALTSLSGSTILRYVRAGTFPAPVPLGPNRRAWSKAAVQGWIDERLKAPD